MTDNELYEELRFDGRTGEPVPEEDVLESIRRIKEAEAADDAQ